MFDIDKQNKIKLTRGDNATILINIKDLDGKDYLIKDTDTITMTVKKSGSASVITKNATPEHFIILANSDTASLATGLYSYQVELITGEGQHYTVITPSFFELMEELA